MKQKKRKIVALHIVLALSLGAMAFFAMALVLDKRIKEQGQEFYAAASEEFIPYDIIEIIEIPVSIAPPIIEEAATPFIDFDTMRVNFPNIVGWIQSQGTVINYPIVQGLDNAYYINRLPDNSRHSMGSIFLDYRNSPDFSDQSIIIYGHDMYTGDMFASLRHYANQHYYEQHPNMYIYTPDQDYSLVLFAGYILDSAVEVPPMSFMDSADFERFITDVRKRSIFTSNVEVNFEDRLVFLATCVASGSVNDRLIIVGKLTV